MLVVIPVSSHDSPLIDNFCAAVNFLGPYADKHQALVVARPADQAYAIRVKDLICSSFKVCDLHLFEKDGPIGWPQGPNFYWYSTVSYLKYINCEQPWLWMELDMTPIEDNWLDTLAGEYTSCGADFLGSLQTIDIGTHFVGAGIYPAFFYKKYQSWHTVMEQALAFDVHCQNEIVPQAQQSKYIEHKFRTSYYKCTNNGLQGLSEARQFIHPEFFTPINKEAVLVHGCVDGSLAALILNKPTSVFEKPYESN